VWRHLGVFAVLRSQRVLSALRAARLSTFLHIHHLPYNFPTFSHFHSPFYLKSPPTLLTSAIMPDDNPVTPPAEAEKPEDTNTSDNKPDEVSETVATSDDKTTGKKVSI